MKRNAQVVKSLLQTKAKKIFVRDINNPNHYVFGIRFNGNVYKKRDFYGDVLVKCERRIYHSDKSVSVLING